MRKPVRTLAYLLAAAALAASLAARASSPGELHIGLTPVFLDEQTALLRVWREYLEARLKRPVAFVKRASYREIVELLNEGKIEFAWLCGYPYVENRKSLNLVALPLYRGKPLYQSYLIVRASDSETRSLGQLRNRVFAYSDPNSNSGFLVVQDALRELGEQPGYFFRKTFFTWAHRKVVEAVGAGLADGGAVDGYVYDVLAKLHPEVVARTRVVAKSRTFGFPPFVAHRRVPRGAVEAFGEALRGMSGDEQGRAILSQLALDGFGEPEPALFEDILRMAQLARDVTRAR